jgi:hypothetical protein
MPPKLTNKKIVITSPLIDAKLTIAFTGKVLPLEHNGEIHIILNTQDQIDLLFDEMLNARLGKEVIPINPDEKEAQTEEASRKGRVRALSHLFYLARVDKHISGDADGDWYLAEGLVGRLENYVNNNPLKDFNAPS